MADYNDTLDLPVMDERKNSREDSSDTCCFRLIARHDVREAGGSRWAPWALHCATRAISSALLIALAVISIPVGRKGLFWYFTYALSAFTYIMLAYLTALFGSGRRASRNTTFPTVIVFAHAFTASLSILNVSDFAHKVAIDRLSGKGFNPASLLLLLPLVVYLVDVLVMQARVRLRYRYSLIVTAVFFLYTFISGVVARANSSGGSSIGGFIGAGLLAVLTMLISSVIAVSLTRIFNLRRG